MPLFPKNIKKMIKEPQAQIQYKKSFCVFCEYFISGIFLLIADFFVITISIKNLSGDSLIYLLILSFMNLLILWVLKISTIVHLLGLHKFANTIDQFAFEILSPNGRINELLYTAAVRIITYIGGLIIFFLYYKLTTFILNQYIEINFIVVFFELAIFHFIINQFFSNLFCLLSKKIQLFSIYSKGKQYYYEVCKNTTYIIFLSLYIIYKYVQLQSGDTSYNALFIESVGTLFLLDTYFDKMKSLKGSPNGIKSKTASNQSSTYEQEELIMQANKNQNELSHSTIQPKGTAEFDISNTAINEYFSVVTNEYQIERSKKQSFETRAGLLLTLLSAICIFYFQSIRLSDIISLMNEPLTFLILTKISSGLIIYFSFIFTFISIIKTLSAKRHNNFEIKNINENLLSENRTDAMARLIFTYRDIIIQHRISNEKRAKWYRTSLYCTFLLLISTIIYISI